MLLGQLVKEICGLFDDKFSVAGSMMATTAVTPISSGGSTSLVEFVEGIALIGQECVSTKFEVVLVFFTTHKLPVLSDPTFSSGNRNHYHSLRGGYGASYHGLPF